jgi:hypothetical protein
VSDWLISKKSSPLKPPGKMNKNLVGSILGDGRQVMANFSSLCLWKGELKNLYAKF